MSEYSSFVTELEIAKLFKGFCLYFKRWSFPTILLNKWTNMDEERGSEGKLRERTIK